MVLDASVVVEWLLGLPRAEAIEKRLADPDRTLHAPHLLSVEVAQVVRRYERAGAISAHRGAEAIVDLGDLGVVHHDHEPLLPRIWRLRANLTAYDATYVALAEVLEVPVLTLDGGLAGAPGHRARIELVGR